MLAHTGSGIPFPRWKKENQYSLHRDVLQTELEFNLRAGITTVDDRMPEHMGEEPLLQRSSVFDITDAELDSAFDTLWRLTWT